MIEKEIWKDIEGYDGLYQVSNLGRVRSLDRVDLQGRRLKGKVLSGRPNKGYLGVALYRDGSAKGYPVHRLIAKAFLDNPSNLPEVNHKDEDKTNNATSNLEWCTSRHNCNYGTRNERIGKSIYVVMNSGHRYFFSSANKAVKLLELKNGAVSRCLHGKLKHHRGFSFEWAV